MGCRLGPDRDDAQDVFLFSGSMSVNPAVSFHEEWDADCQPNGIHDPNGAATG